MSGKNSGKHILHASDYPCKRRKKMPSWCLTISDAEPPAPGIYKRMQRIGGTDTISVHNFRSTNRRAGGEGFFIYTGGHAIDWMYPHVSVMLTRPLYQKAGLLFFQ